jgi:chromosome segregation ATPase
MALVKGIVRYGVIAGLAGGAVTLIAGPDRVAAIFTETRTVVQNQIDKNISDPVAMRSQLRQLAEQYPGRIQDVRGDLAELQSHKQQLNRELATQVRISELAQADIGTLGQLITRADETLQEAQVRNASFGAEPIEVRIRFANETMNVDQAMQRATQIEQVRVTAETAAADMQRDLGYIEQQETRLNDLLTQLESERDSFNAQLFALDRQVDAIARNDRMIEMMEKRQATIDKQSRYRAHSLDQLQGRFAEIRARQEAQLESLGKGTTALNYESRAKFDLDVRPQADGSRVSGTKATGASLPRLKPSVVIQPKVIEIKPELVTPSDDCEGESAASSTSHKLN